MAEVLAALGYRRIGTANFMTRFIIWAMRADLPR